jgi:hypothetical protein
MNAVAFNRCRKQVDGPVARKPSWHSNNLPRLAVEMTVKRLCGKLKLLQNNTYRKPVMMEWE